MSKTKQIIATVLDAQFIGSRIFNIRGLQVMLDSDLAELYQVETKALNQAVKRNMERFQSQKHSTSQPSAFTEQGVAMLSAVLRSDVAVQVSIAIMSAFVEMRSMVRSNSHLLKRMDLVEHKQILTDQRVDALFDAHAFVSGLVKSAKKSLVLIANYIDESVLVLFSKRAKNVSQRLELDVRKFNEQYPPIALKDLGKKWFAFSKMDLAAVDVLKAAGEV